MVRPTATLVKVYHNVTPLIAAVLLPPLVVTGFFAVEVLSGLVQTRKVARSARPAADAVRATVVIPAHDEEAVLGKTLQSLQAAVPDASSILVIADNCRDQTAAIASRHGARVAERNNAVQRGKGFALDHARNVLRADPPEVVVVVDADCTIDPTSLAELIGTAARTGRPCQSVNLLRPTVTAGPMVQISTFAFMLKNLVRQRGLQRLAGRVHLTGTGMALPWQHFAAADLATASIVEDIRLGFELAEAGSPPQLVEDATIWSSSSNEGGTLVQRRRWEGGFLDMARRSAPEALARSLRRFDLRGLAAGLDLCVPPLALLVLIDVGLLAAAAAVTAISGASWWPALTFAGVLGVAGAAILAAWAKEGRRFLSPAVLLRLPLYVAWKLPLYLGLTRRGVPDDWLRTGR